MAANENNYPHGGVVSVSETLPVSTPACQGTGERAAKLEAASTPEIEREIRRCSGRGEHNRGPVPSATGRNDLGCVPVSTTLVSRRHPPVVQSAFNPAPLCTGTAENAPAPNGGLVGQSSLSAWDLDPTPLRGIRMPHPMECEPRRTPRNPKWLPPKRDKRDAGAVRPLRCPPEWGRPKLIAAPDAGAVRIGMTWRKFFVTSASFSRKAGRTMFFEGPHEPASYRLLEIGHRTTDLQFQPLVAVWEEDGRVFNRYYVDSVEERDDGSLVFRENKAHRAYFDDPAIDEKLSAFEAQITLYPNVRFEREVGTDLMDPLKWRIAKDIYDDRRLYYSDAQRDAVRDLLTRESGIVPLAKVWEAIGGREADARRIANAMMVARLVGYRVDRKPARDTKAVLPRPPAIPGRLRSFLASFAPKIAK